jgi:MFS family permease
MPRHGSEFTRSAVLTAIGCAIGMAAGPTPMVSAVAGLFMKPLAGEFGLSRTAISAILLLSPLVVSLCAPTGGRLIDKFGVRRVLLPVVLLFAAANAAMWLVHSLWHYVALAAVISACISVHCYASYTKVLALWFRRRRGVITGLSIACGSGLGAAVIPQLVTPWIAEHGWRYAYLGIAAIIAFVALPALALLVREPAAPPRPSRARSDTCRADRGRDAAGGGA